jgi:hypothetical protein
MAVCTVTGKLAPMLGRLEPGMIAGGLVPFCPAPLRAGCPAVAHFVAWPASRRLSPVISSRMSGGVPDE